MQKIITVQADSYRKTPLKNLCQTLLQPSVSQNIRRPYKNQGIIEAQKGLTSK